MLRPQIINPKCKYLQQSWPQRRPGLTLLTFTLARRGRGFCRKQPRSLVLSMRPYLTEPTNKPLTKSLAAKCSQGRAAGIGGTAAGATGARHRAGVSLPRAHKGSLHKAVALLSGCSCRPPHLGFDILPESKAFTHSLLKPLLQTFLGGICASAWNLQPSHHKTFLGVEVLM